MKDKLIGMAEELREEAAGRLTKQAALLLERVATLAERIDSLRFEGGRHPAPPPKPSRRRTALLLLVGAGAGYLAAYFLDPEHGLDRRAASARWLSGVGHDASRVAQRTTVLATDRASGIKSRVLARGSGARSEEKDLLDRVESAVFRDPAVPKGDIKVMVVEGRAVLRGQVAEQQIAAIEAAVRKVSGVKDVENLLHSPGRPAPTRAGAGSATSSVGNGSSTG